MPEVLHGQRPGRSSCPLVAVRTPNGRLSNATAILPSNGVDAADTT